MCIAVIHIVVVSFAITVAVPAGAILVLYMLLPANEWGKNGK